MTTSQAWLPKEYSTWFSIQKLNPSKELQFREQTGDVCIRCKPYDDTDDEEKLTSLADKVALLVPTFELWAALTSKPDPHLRLRPQLPESDWCQVSSHLLRDWFGLKVMSALQPTMEVTIDVNSETSGSNIIEYGKRSKFAINLVFASGGNAILPTRVVFNFVNTLQKPWNLSWTAWNTHSNSLSFNPSHLCR